MIFARVVVADLWYKERSDWVASLRRCPPTETSLIDFAVSNLLNHFLENNSPLLCEFQTSKDPPHSKFFQKAALVWLYSCAAQDWKEREKNPSRFSFFGGFSYNFIHFTLQSKTFSISSTCRLQLLTLALPRSLSQHRSPSPLRMLPVEANTNWAKFKIRMVVLTLYSKASSNVTFRRPLPCRSRAFTLAPDLSNSFTISKWASRNANCKQHFLHGNFEHLH